MWFPNRSDTNRPVQAQKQARSLKFWIYKVEELYYLCSENKDADQPKLICAFVFAYADCWFSNVAAHMSGNNLPWKNDLWGSKLFPNKSLHPCFHLWLFSVTWVVSGYVVL